MDLVFILYLMEESHENENVFLRSRIVGLIFSHVLTLPFLLLLSCKWSIVLFFCTHYEVPNLAPIHLSTNILLLFARLITETSCMGCRRRISNLIGKCSQSYPCMNHTVSSRWSTYHEMHFQETRMW